MRVFPSITALACLLGLALPAFAGAAPADLDRSFGGDGMVQVEGSVGGSIFPAESSARMAIGPEDETFVLFSRYVSCSPPSGCVIDLAVARYDSAGNRDQSFGVGPDSQLQGSPEH